MKGKFITIEGPDGAGKSTNVILLINHLRNMGHTVVSTREPGGTELGEKLRTILLSDHMRPTTELLLFAAQRAEHIESKIKPALAAGHIVVSDRFFDSTYAYQGARGYMFQVLQLEDFVHKGFQPDYTLFFNIPFEESIRRLGIREGVNGGDRFETANIEYRKLVYEMYQQRFAINPHRMVPINANQTPELVGKEVIAWAEKTFG